MYLFIKTCIDDLYSVDNVLSSKQQDNHLYELCYIDNC